MSRTCGAPCSTIPEAVAEAACWPVNECDLHARHLWLVNNLPKLAARLMADPEYHEAAHGWLVGVGRVLFGLEAAGARVMGRGTQNRTGRRTRADPRRWRRGGKQLPHLGDAGRA